MSSSSTMASLYTIPSSKTVTGVAMTMVAVTMVAVTMMAVTMMAVTMMAVTMMAVSWRSRLLLKVKRDGRLHVTHVGGSKLKMKLFGLWKELARAKECLWHRSILWVVCSIGLSRVQHRISRWHG